MSDLDSENIVSKTVTVARSAESAFRIWTEQIRTWWPKTHSISGDPLTQVFIEGKVGGRVYERSSNGTEFDWGMVEVWEPPHYLAHTWYLGSGQKLPSRVEVRFVPLGRNRTRIELEHRGPELIGELWWQRVAVFREAWAHILPLFAAAV